MRVEYRSAPRRRPDIAIDIIDCMSEMPAGKMLDISATGIRIASPAPLQPDALYQWRFAIPDTPNTERMECGVQILWVQAQAGGHYAVGARFIQMPPQGRERLRRWCALSG